MQRYKLVLGGTAAGIAGVLAFPTHSPKLTIPSAGASTGGSTGSTAGSTGGSTAGPPVSSGASTTRSATSADVTFPYGDLAVKVTVTGSKITNVSMAAQNETDGRSASIDNYALPQLEQQVLSADSVNINGVSGATFTSQAFVNAVANALQKLGLPA